MCKRRRLTEERRGEEEERRGEERRRSRKEKHEKNGVGEQGTRPMPHSGLSEGWVGGRLYPVAALWSLTSTFFSREE
jgi:hypothetical protein